LSKHPNTHLVEVRCTSCGSSFTTRSTADQDLVVDTCSSCHPAFTDRERSLASGSRVERFNRRRALAAR